MVRTLTCVAAILAILLGSGRSLTTGFPDPVTWLAALSVCAALAGADSILQRYNHRLRSVGGVLSLCLFGLSVVCGGFFLSRLINDSGFALNAATAGGYDSLVEWSVRRGADVNRAENQAGRPTASPLEIAVNRRRQSTVDVLLRLGADPNRKGFRRQPLAVIAAQAGDVRTLEDLWRHGLDLNAKSQTNGMTALMQAIESQNGPIVEFLLQHGANPNLQNERGWTALMMAACRDKPDRGWISLLLNDGADRSIEDKGGKTALDYAKMCSSGSVNLLNN